MGGNKVSGRSPKVRIRRGNRIVDLFKSSTKIDVRLRGMQLLEEAPEQIVARLKLPPAARLIKMDPHRRRMRFSGPAEERDSIMTVLRSRKKDVRYVSHVFTRRRDDEKSEGEVGLDDKFFVKFKEKPNKSEVNEIEQGFGVRRIWPTANLKTHKGLKKAEEFWRGAVFQLTEKAGENPIEISAAIMKWGKYATVEPCLFEKKIAHPEIGDPGVENQWHLSYIKADKAWNQTRGSARVAIAIIDDGFDLDHPDLDIAGKIGSPYDASTGGDNPRPVSDLDNHGTPVAGLAVAAIGGGGTVGVAPQCSLMPIRHGGMLGDFEEALAFFSVFANGGQVINCSWGPPEHYDQDTWPMSSLTQLLIDLCAVYGRDGKGIPIVFSAGNGSERVEYNGYASYKNVIAVSACTDRGEKAWYTNYGSKIWITAPSSGGNSGLYTTDRLGAAGYSESDYTATFGGASGSAPLIAGVIGLMLSVNSALTVQNVKDILKNTAIKINRGKPVKYTDYWGNGYTDQYDAKGHSEVYGWGLVDAEQCVAKALNYS